MSFTITPVDYAKDSLSARIADQIMAKANVDKNDVAEIVVDDTTATLTVYLRNNFGKFYATRPDNLATTEITVVWP